MTTYNNHAAPSNNPADDDSLAGVLRSAFRKFMQQTDDMLPAVVIAFDRTKNRATVAPCVSVLTTDGRQVARAQVASVPVMQFGGGGCVLNFNLKTGDLGWIKASDRDISLFLQSFASPSPPNTLRMHTFQDGVFIPEVMRGWTIAAEDAQAAVLQTLDGNAKVSVQTDKVKLAVGAMSVTIGTGGTTIDGPLTVTGATTMQAGATVTQGLGVDGIRFGTHVHTNVTSGTDNSGGPSN